MNSKFIVAILVVVCVLSGLIYSASTSTAKAVVTVEELVGQNSPRDRVRLGARVTDEEIQFVSRPEREVRFTVRDIEGDGGIIPVVYYGSMPDTLRDGRDVIMEGHFDGQQFVAKTLMTQCPSKYEPPMPGTDSPGTDSKTQTSAIVEGGGKYGYD